MKQIIFVLLFLFVGPSFVYAANIDATDKYARFLNTGTLINFGATNGNVTVTSSAVTGKAWSSAFGWINLSPTQGGVVNDGAGVLSGYAWGENTGWINFKPTNGGVTIDSTGDFHGYAWSESKGWIVFNCATDSSCGTLSHKVKTTWIPTTTTTTGGSGWVNTVNSQIPQPTPPTSVVETPSQADVTPDTESPSSPLVVEQPSTETPSQISGAVPSDTSSHQGSQDNAGTISGGVVSEGDTPVGGASDVVDNTQLAPPTFSEKIFGFATKATGMVSGLFSKAVSSIENGLGKISSILAAPVVGSVTVLSLVVTGGAAVLLLFVLSRLKSALIKSTSSLLTGLSSWWARLVALLVIKRRTPEKPIETLKKEEATPVFIEPQITVAPTIDEVKKEEVVSWNIKPQPVILPEDVAQVPVQGSANVDQAREVLQEHASTPTKLEPMAIVSHDTVKELPAIKTPIKEKILSDNKKSSRDDFMSLFMVKNPIEQPAVTEPAAETKVDEPEVKEVEVSPELPLVPEVKNIQEISEVTTGAESLVPPSIVEVPAQVVSSSEAVPITPVIKVENEIRKNWFQKTGTKLMGRFEQFSRKMAKNMHKISKEVKPAGEVKKRVWNPRPPTGTD